MSKTKKYVMTQSRSINGEYILATPEQPVLIEVDADVKPGKDMTEATEDTPALKTIYASKASHPHLSKTEMMPFDATEKRASGQMDKIEYRPESKGATDTTGGHTVKHK